MLYVLVNHHPSKRYFVGIEAVDDMGHMHNVLVDVRQKPMTIVRTSPDIADAAVFSKAAADRVQGRHPEFMVVAL